MASKTSLQNLRYEVFKNQDQELGNFDVTFLIENKTILANKCMLVPVSTTFASMLAERWTSKDDPIPIAAYSYDEFYQFLTFLYTNKCQLTNENIAAMVDMAEFYQVSDFKKFCEKNLKNFEWTPQNAFRILETSIKYSMVGLKKSIFKSVKLNFFTSDEFLDISKELLRAILEADQNVIPNDEEMFERVYHWAEKHAVAKKALEPNLNLEETVKEILAEFMPLFFFDEMDRQFVTKFVVAKSLLPSGRKRNAALSNLDEDEDYVVPKTIVKITDANGRVMKGRFDDYEDVFDEIQSLPDKHCRLDFSFNFAEDESFYYWPTNRGRSDQYLGNDYGKKWCLTYSDVGQLCIKKGTNGRDVDLVAEMIAEEKFALNDDCTIEAIRY